MTTLDLHVYPEMLDVDLWKLFACLTGRPLSGTVPDPTPFELATICYLLRMQWDPEFSLQDAVALSLQELAAIVVEANNRRAQVLDVPKVVAFPGPRLPGA